MEVRIYRYENGILRREGLTRLATGHYAASRYEPGKFEITLPAGAPFALSIKANDILLFDRAHWGVVTGRLIEHGTANTITTAGAELTEWLARRTIVPDSSVAENHPMGYDSVAGSTEAVIKHYIEKHAVNPENENRKIPLLTIAENQNRGIQDDAYMARYVNLMDTIGVIGKRGGLGVKITGTEAGGFVFDVAGKIDKTTSQSVRKPLVLEVSRRTLESSSFSEEYGQSNNVFYCSRAGDEYEWETLTQTYFMDDDEPRGFDRRETSLSISVYDEGNQYQQLEINARKEMEKYRAARSVTCAMSRQLLYGKDYSIGDVVTVIDREAGMTADMEITAVDTVVSAETTTFTATFGEPVISVFQKIERGIKK